MNRLLLPTLLVGVLLAGPGLAACYQTPSPECAFACESGGDESCPTDYTCRADNICRRVGVPDSFACPDLPRDAAVTDTGTDAPIDVAEIDAPTDAAIDGIDAASIDAAVDAATDAPTDAATDAPADAFAGLRITTTGPVDFGTTPMGTAVTRPIVVTNDGSAQTGNITVTVATGTGYARVTAGDTCNGQPLTMGNTCTFDVSFDPLTAGAGTLTGMAQVTASPGGTTSINLTGFGQ